MFCTCHAYLNKKSTNPKIRFVDFSVVLGGLEPPLTEPKTVVLPLHHGTININCFQFSGAKVIDFSSTTKFLSVYFTVIK